MNGQPLSCRELVEQVTEYLEQQLSEAERASFEAHLEACGACTRYVEQIRTTIQAIGTLRAPAHTPADTNRREALARLFTAWREQHDH